MKILNKEQLMKMPNGTVFTCWFPNYLSEDIHILTGRYKDKDGWNGELNLCPQPVDIADCNLSKLDEVVKSELVTTDVAHNDYEDNQLFAVFSKTEIRQMIKWLQYAIGDIKEI